MTKRVDPKWQEVQEATLVNWANATLRGPISADSGEVPQIVNLKEDIKDGGILLELLDNVSSTLGSGKRVRRRYNKPKLDVQKRENISECFKFIERENIKLVNIGVIDVMEGNVKLMLGLIWTLIRRYQIKSSGKAVSTKQAMLQWLETLIPEKNITNFNKDWNDGTALCTLVDRLKPGLCPNHSVLNPEKGLENCDLGMNLARKEFDIPLILKPEHLNNPKVDEMSVMTYISYFCKPAIENLLAWVQSKIPHQNITNFGKDWSTGVNLAALLDSISPGLFPDWSELDPHNAIENLEKGMVAAGKLGVERVLKPADFAAPDVDEINIVTYISRIRKSKPMSLPSRCTVTGQGINKAFLGREAHFEVNATNAGIGKLEIQAKSSTGIDVPVATTETRKAVFNASYTPTEPGHVIISVKWGDREVDKGPFKCSVVNPGTFKFYGPEITEGKLGRVGRTVTMFAEGLTDVKDLKVLINGKDSIVVSQTGTHEAECTYIPRKAGTDSVAVSLAGQSIPQSPFEVHVLDPSICKVISSDTDPAMIGKPLSIKVDAGNDDNMRGVTGKASWGSETVSLITDWQDNNTVVVRYTPKELGSHKIDILCLEEKVQGSPVSFEVIDSSKVTLKDSIPKYVHLGKPDVIVFEAANTGKGKLEATSSNPGVLTVSVTDAGRNQRMVNLNPLSLGVSEVNITFGGQSLPGFPTMIKVCDASVCSAYGVGLSSRQGKTHELFEFTVQAVNAGEGELEVIPAGPNSRYAADIENLGNGKYNCSFTSYEPGLHSIEILWSGQPIPDSPVSVKFVNTVSGQFTASGEGLEKCIARQTAQFMLLGPESGLLEDGVLEVEITGNGLKSSFVPSLGPTCLDPEILVCVADLESGKYQVQYCVPDNGDYDISITCSKEHIVGSPFNCYALPAPDPDKCRVFGPAIDEPEHIVVGKPIEFRVDSTDAGTGSLEVFAFDPTMAALPVYLAEQKGKRNERIHIVKIDPKFKGKQTFEVKWSGQHIPGSPFRFEAGDPRMVKIVSIPDKETYIPKIGERFEVVVDDSSAGPGEVAVKVKLPNDFHKNLPVEKAPNSKHKKFSFTPTEVGRIELLVTYSGINVLNYPWVADVINTKLFEVVSSVVYAKQGEYVKYVVAGMKKSNAKNMQLKARNDAFDHDATVKVDMKKDGSAIARFTAKHIGKYEVSILCAKQHVSGSPFPVYVVNPKNAQFLSNLPSTLALGRSYIIEIDGSKCGPGELQYSLDQQNDSPCIVCNLESVVDGVYKVSIKPVAIGEVELSFQWEDFPIDEPQPLSVVDVRKCRFWSPQLKDKRTIKQHDEVTLHIDVTGCGNCVPEVVAKGPQATYDTTVEKKSDGKFTATFTPWQSGDHSINISLGLIKVPNSPVKFLVLKDITPDQIIASGDGLKEAFTEQKSVVKIYGLESGFMERGQLTHHLYSIVGDYSTPTVDSECVDIGNGVYELSYTPHEDGDHCLEIFYEGEHIASSPFKVSIKPIPRADKCIASGRIIQPNEYLPVNEQAVIKVDSQKAGAGVLKAGGKQPDGSLVQVFINYEEKEKLHYLLFNGSKIGKYTIAVEWNDIPIPKSPFTVRVIDPNRCFIGGEIPTSILVRNMKMITVDTTGAGCNDLQVLLDGQTSSPDIKCSVKESSVAQYEVELEGRSVGSVEISIQLGGYDIAKSPFTVDVCDASKCILVASNVKNGYLQAERPFQFAIKTDKAGRNKPIVRPSPGSDAQYIINVSTNDDGNLHTVVCTPHTIGRQQLDVIWADDHVPGSPLSFSVFDPNECRVIGLEDSSTFIPVIGENITFSIDQSDAGPGEVEVCAQYSDGTEDMIPATTDGVISDFEFSPKIPGRFELILEFNGVSILKTPWITDIPDPMQFKVTPPKSTGMVYEPVKLFITGITKQKQNFTVSAVHPDHPATVTIEHSKEGNTAVATFTPEAVGQYIVHVKHAYNNIEGSPFNVDVVNLNALDITNPPPEKAVVNKEYSVTMLTSEAGNGPLQCQLTGLAGNDSISFTTTIDDLPEDEGEGMEIRFKADSVGTGQMTLRWGDHVVSPSPYSVHFIDPSKVTVSCPKIEKGEPLNLSEPIEVIINCREAGRGVPDIKVTNRSSDVDSTAINVQDKKDGTFVATMTPWKSGLHELATTFGGYPISETPMMFEVQKIIDPRGIACFGEGLHNAIVQQTNALTINASMPGLVSDGHLKVSCVCVKEDTDGAHPSTDDLTTAEDEERCDAQVELVDKNDGTYALSVSYPEVGDYVLYVTYKDQPIYQSPFNVSVKSAPNAGSCKVFGAAIDKMRKGQAFVVSQSIQFMIDTTAAGNGYLMCTVDDPSGDPIRVFSNEEESNGQKIAYLQFDPYEVGNYTVKIFWSSEPIPETPLIFCIVDPTRCLVHGLPLPNNGAVQIGEEIEFAIAPSNCGYSTPQVYLTEREKDEEEKRVSLESEVTENGVYRYKHKNEESGRFNINVTIGGCHIPGSPYKCDVLDPNQFAIFGLNLKSKYAIVCELVSFKIQGKPPEGETFVVTAHGPLADLSCDLNSVSDNLMESSFVPIEPGSYEVFVECANKHVTGSPFTVNVADPSKCQLLEVSSQLQVGVTHELVVKSRGAGIGELNAMIQGDEDGALANVKVEDQGLETYHVVIEPHKVIDVELVITWGGYPIPQAPIHLSICDANQCKVYGQAILSKKGKVGEAITFSIVTSNAGNSKPVVKAAGPSAQYNITPKEAGENKFEAQFTPWEIGAHNVEILWGSTKVPNSPFEIDVEKNIGGLPTCHATGEGLKRAISGQQAMFTLVSNEVGLLENDVLKVSVAGVRGTAEIELTDMNDGCYQVKYRPPNPGAYIASVNYYNRPIPGSPFKISCMPGPDASKCRVEGLHPNSLFLTGNPIEFTVNTSEAGYGQLRVFIQGPKDYHPKVYVADDGKGSHFVKFDAMQQGRYMIVVAWSDKHVPGSPFKVKVHPAPDASKVVVEGPGLQNTSLEGSSEFSIDTKQAGIGTLLIRVHGIKDSFKIEANPLKADDPRILIANYNPKREGDYTIFVRWSGVHVPGSPFSIHLRDGESAELDARKMIRGAKRLSTDQDQEPRRRRVSRERKTSADGRRRRTSSKEKIVAVSESEAQQKQAKAKVRKISRNEEVVVQSRRIIKQDPTASLPQLDAAAGGRRKTDGGTGGFFRSLFGGGSSSSSKGMNRTRSGSDLPSIGPVKPKMKMKKNPSMGQMPMYVPQSVSPMDQPLKLEKKEARRGQRKKSKMDPEKMIDEEVDAAPEEPVVTKPKKKKKKGFELS